MISKAWSTLDSGRTYQRELGLSERALHPASLKDGLGDMFIYLEVNLPSDLAGENLMMAWAILRARHPLLAAEVVDGRFVHTVRDVDLALDCAKRSLTREHASKTQLIDNHMNGPRFLSDKHLSHLTVTPEGIFLIAPHFIGDGTCLHTSMQELLVLLSAPVGRDRLEVELSAERLSPDLETQLPRPVSALQRAAWAIDYQIRQARDIGGQELVRCDTAGRHTVLEEITYSEGRTAHILAQCKKQGVSISNVFFALITVAWSRICHVEDRSTLPTLIYTAHNLRSHLPPSASNWFLALGYLNIVLPSFPPADLSDGLWRRARSARRQTIIATSSPRLLSCALVSAEQRVARALNESRPPIVDTTTPRKALCGVSLIGDLDKVYIQAELDPRISLGSVTTASKQRASGILLLVHSFRGKLSYHLAWDEHGFREGMIPALWREVQSIMETIFEA